MNLGEYHGPDAAFAGYPAGNEGSSPGMGWADYPAMHLPRQLPTYYQYQNTAISQYHPSTVHVTNTALTAYFAKYLLQKAMSVFKWQIPETWDKDFFLYTLYCFGRVAIINTDKFGIIPQMCSLGGFNVFYRPAYVLISNPLFDREYKLNINSQCTVIKMQADYGGIMDVVTYYASLMACAAEAIGINIFNTRLAYVFFADNKNVGETYKKMFDKIAGGNPAVVIDKNLLDESGNPHWQAFNQNINQTYIADKLLADLRKIESMFATDVGLPNANTDKRERLITDEVNANNVETASKMELVLDHLKKGCEETRKLFGIKISVDWRHNPLEVQGQVNDNAADSNN